MPIPGIFFDAFSHCGDSGTTAPPKITGIGLRPTSIMACNIISPIISVWKAALLCRRSCDECSVELSLDALLPERAGHHRWPDTRRRQELMEAETDQIQRAKRPSQPSISTQSARRNCSAVFPRHG